MQKLHPPFGDVVPREFPHFTTVPVGGTLSGTAQSGVLDEVSLSQWSGDPSLATPEARAAAAAEFAADRDKRMSTFAAAGSSARESMVDIDELEQMAQDAARTMEAERRADATTPV